MKKTSKKRYFLIVSAFLMMFSISSVFALGSDAVVLNIGKVSAETRAVGLSKTANFKVTTYSDSKAPTNAAVHARWANWPYTLEQNKVVPIGQTWTGTEPQDKDSYFFVKLWSMNANKTHSYGKISIN